MKLLRAVVAAIALLVPVAQTAPVHAAGGSDLSIDLIVYKGDHGYDQVHKGPLVIGSEYTFLFKVRNDGPSDTTATLRYDVHPTEGGRYTWWSVPVRWDGYIVYEGGTRCDRTRCRLSIRAGQERWVVGLYADANAPGRVSVAGSVSSSVSDPDTSITAPE